MAPGPILLSIYVNDLSESLPGSFVVQYADDTQLFVWKYRMYLGIHRVDKILLTAYFSQKKAYY